VNFYSSDLCSTVPSCCGPVVLHGGFTSAFSEFGEDMKGTGKLLISIACWLTRIELRLSLARLGHGMPLTTIPALRGNYGKTGIFKGWTPIPTKYIPWYSIIVLDSSFSMEDTYSSLIECVNDFIIDQTSKKGIISVISFSDSASIIRTKDNKTLASMEGYNGGCTSFSEGFRLANQLADDPIPNYETRVLFFTDGYPNDNDPYIVECDNLFNKGVVIHAIGFGSVNKNILDTLVRNEGLVYIGKTMVDVAQAFQRIGAT
jgi:hypothetical protein